MHYRHAPRLALVSVAAVCVAACGHGGSTPTPRPTPTTRSTSSATATGTQTELALQAFESSVLAFDTAAREMNPDDPKIPATATGDQVIHELTTLNSWKLQGITAKGDLPHVVDSRVTSMSTTTAQVKACVHDPSVFIYAATGKPAPYNAAGQSYFDIDATLTFVTGFWKVSSSKTQSEFNSCLPGY